MNPANYRLSKEVLQDMINDDNEKMFNRFSSIYKENIKGQSPDEQSLHLIDELFSKHLSEPLKKMEVDYFKVINEKCYKEKHMSDAMPNYVKIDECKNLERQKIFSKFDKFVHQTRESSKFRYQDCLYEANNNIDAAISCIENYLSALNTDNLKITAQFKVDYPKYV